MNQQQGGFGGSADGASTANSVDSIARQDAYRAESHERDMQRSKRVRNRVRVQGFMVPWGMKP